MWTCRLGPSYSATVQMPWSLKRTPSDSRLQTFATRWARRRASWTNWRVPWRIWFLGEFGVCVCVTESVVREREKERWKTWRCNLQGSSVACWCLVELYLFWESSIPTCLLLQTNCAISNDLYACMHLCMHACMLHTILLIASDEVCPLQWRIAMHTELIFWIPRLRSRLQEKKQMPRSLR